MAALRHVIMLNVDIKVAVLLLAIEIVRGTSCIKYHVRLYIQLLDITVHELILFHDW